MEEVARAPSSRISPIDVGTIPVRRYVANQALYFLFVALKRSSARRRPAISASAAAVCARLRSASRISCSACRCSVLPLLKVVRRLTSSADGKANRFGVTESELEVSVQSMWSRFCGRDLCVVRGPSGASFEEELWLLLASTNVRAERVCW